MAPSPRLARPLALVVFALSPFAPLAIKSLGDAARRVGLDAGDAASQSAALPECKRGHIAFVLGAALAASIPTFHAQTSTALPTKIEVTGEAADAHHFSGIYRNSVDEPAVYTNGEATLTWEPSGFGDVVATLELPEEDELAAASDINLNKVHFGTTVGVEWPVNPLADVDPLGDAARRGKGVAAESPGHVNGVAAEIAERIEEQIATQIEEQKEARDRTAQELEVQETQLHRLVEEAPYRQGLGEQFEHWLESMMKTSQATGEELEQQINKWKTEFWLMKDAELDDELRQDRAKLEELKAKESQLHVQLHPKADLSAPSPSSEEAEVVADAPNSYWHKTGSASWSWPWHWSWRKKGTAPTAGQGEAASKAEHAETETLEEAASSEGDADPQKIEARVFAKRLELQQVRVEIAAVSDEVAQETHKLADASVGPASLLEKHAGAAAGHFNRWRVKRVSSSGC